ncbi:MAG TPA: hypothetical protein DCP06_04925, partial [Lachnospiraceae bacterium]|nr:hypothetical protein [Lachnospiraceae bacterium]
MRLKRNVVTIIYSGIFVLIMLMGCLYLVTESYERFAADGMEWIFIILLVIACLLYIIGAYFLKEKAALKGIQTESSSLIVVEGILVVALIGLLFYTAMSTSVEAGIWMGVYLALVYGCSRVLGGRLCGLGGAVFGFLIVFFGLDSGWIAFSSDEMIAVMSLLAPFFVFLLMTKFIIPQFAKNNAIIVCSMLVLGALFGMAINLNVIAAFLCVGCVLSLIFGKLRSADTIPTKGPVLAGMCFGFSVIGTVGLSFLLEKDLGSVLSFPIESGFDNAVAGGETVTYALDKIHTMFAQVLLHSFDYGLLGIIILLFGIAAGLFTILRKLSGMGPMLLAFVGAVCYYIVGAEPGSHSYYVTFLAALFAAYGLYNSLLPEFLGKFMDDEDEEEKTSSKKSRLKGKVADENKRSGASDSDAVLGVSDNVDSLKGPNSNDAPGVGVDMSGKEKVVEYTPTPEDTHFQEWHVSEEFIREDKLRKERQEERERSYALAKAQQAAREKGASEEELKAMAIASENEAKAKASGRVVFSGGFVPDAPGKVGAPAEADSISAVSIAQDNSVSVSDSDNSLQFEQSEPEGVASLEFTDAVTPDDSESKIEFIQQEPEDRSESTIDVMDTAGNYANGEFMDISGANLDESESKATEATYGQLGSDQDDNASETVAVETEAPEESAVTENAAPEIEASVVEAADEAGAANEDTASSGYEEEVKEDTGSSTVYSGYGGSSSAVDVNVKSVTGAYSEPLGVAATTAAALGSAMSTAVSGIVTGDILNHNETGSDEDSGPDMSNLSAGSGYSEPELMSTYRPDS